jgi:hypothetical protein
MWQHGMDIHTYGLIPQCDPLRQKCTSIKFSQKMQLYLPTLCEGAAMEQS